MVDFNNLSKHRTSMKSDKLWLSPVSLRLKVRTEKRRLTELRELLNGYVTVKSLLSTRYDKTQSP